MDRHKQPDFEQKMQSIKKQSQIYMLNLKTNKSQVDNKELSLRKELSALSASQINELIYLIGEIIEENMRLTGGMKNSDEIRQLFQKQNFIGEYVQSITNFQQKFRGYLKGNDDTLNSVSLIFFSSLFDEAKVQQYQIREKNIVDAMSLKEAQVRVLKHNKELIENIQFTLTQKLEEWGGDQKVREDFVIFQLKIFDLLLSEYSLIQSLFSSILKFFGEDSSNKDTETLHNLVNKGLGYITSLSDQLDILLKE